MSGMYGPVDRDESIATIHAALDAGIDVLDTGDFYGMGQAAPPDAVVGDRCPAQQMAILDSERG